MPADAVLHSVAGLWVDESLLTGESLPVEKQVFTDGAREGQVFSGTLVIKGQGRAEVAATGCRTQMGRIGVSLATIESGKTALQIETARVVMITGDHPGTALAIARQAGIDTASGVLTGADIATMNDAELAEAAARIPIYARIAPEQKLRLLMAYKSAGEVVAMTGDGVNDAPALKAAHIGVAMGLRGTDVAREAPALVLLQDDFGSIVETVRLGRRIYRNIRNAMRYVISVHVPTVGMVFLPLALGWPLVLFPVHVVFLEFIIDPACSIVFEAESSGDAQAMTQPPRDPAQPLFDARMVTASVLVGVAGLIAVVLAYGWALTQGRSEGAARALAFAAIVYGNLALIIINRTDEKFSMAALRQPNPALWWIVLGTVAALTASVYVAPVAALFRFEPLALHDQLIALAAGVAGVCAVELVKRMRRAM